MNNAMERKVHELKIHPKYYEDILNEVKTFEVRKNDRAYKVGDFLQLNEFDNGKYTGQYTGRFKYVEIIYILEGGSFGIDKDYIVMSIR